MEIKRVTIFAGHYGSGKTNVAVNFALQLKKLGKKVVIYDLDIVNPYFRTVDAENLLKAAGVELVVSPYAETNVDIPAMNAASYKMIDDKSAYAVIDLGGDDRGALALGRFSDKIKAENNYDMLMVVNPYRPETRTLQDLLQIKNEIEFTGRIKFTGLVNNANLGKETSATEIAYGKDFCEKIKNQTGLPVKFTCVDECVSCKNLIDGEIMKLSLIDYKIY